LKFTFHSHADFFKQEKTKEIPSSIERRKLLKFGSQEEVQETNRQGGSEKGY
jgi:hypothetical protein